MGHPQSFTVVLPPDVKASVERHAAELGQRRQAEFIREAIKTDVSFRERYGDRYDVVKALLGRLDPEAVEDALFAARSEDG